MTDRAVINSQDWYRVRRSEDQIAWGRRWGMTDLPGVVLSERARDEFAFLEAQQRTALTRVLRDSTDDPDDAKGTPVAYGQDLRMLRVGDLRVVFRVHEGEAWISTIRGGPVLDPEHTGPPPEDEIDWRRG